MDKIFVIDASGYLYRSYHAIRMMTNAQGDSTNALFGFTRSILKIIKDFNPSHLVAVFDGPNNARKRIEIYADYKAHRKEMPADLRYQIRWAQEYCPLLGIAELMLPDVEADDTMGSIARWAESIGSHVYLCTTDKDMCQVVTDHVSLVNTYKDNFILNPVELEKQYGIRPNQIIDFLAMTGDASDNIPGLPGFGPKTAVELLNTFGSLDYILDHPLEISGKKKQDTLIEYREQGLLSRRLVTLEPVEIPTDPNFYQLKPASLKELKEFYAKMNFNSLLKELESQVVATPLAEEQTDDTLYQLVDDEATLAHLVEYLSGYKEICIKTEITGASAFSAELVGIGIGVEQKKAWYIPVNGRLEKEAVLGALKPLFTSPMISFYGHNIKEDYHTLLNYGIRLSSIGFDTVLASYLLNSHNHQHSLGHLSLENFRKVSTSAQDLLGKGKNQLELQNIPIERVCEYCCERVDYAMRLKEIFLPQLKERNLIDILEKIELPLLPVLVSMERHGIFVDAHILHHLSEEITHRIRQLEDDIYALAGETFNLNSPKQLSTILFTKLGIKPPKKTATGLSTDAKTLENLKSDYPIAQELLKYRTLEKLRSTYIDALPQEINAHTHRIHCNFNQFMAATGRLSCQNPNLQNIPVRTAEGRKIREAFRPQHPDWSYLAADYSQIELRLLAHLSGEPALIAAFEAKEDVHAYTASLIFNIPLEEVTPEQRNQAKTVNFGILYGQQAIGLAEVLNIDTKTAATFIQMYFERYPRIKSFIESCKQFTKETGKAVTIFGRERLIPEINNKNGMIRSAAERLAINTPIQGSQADIIKLSMIQINKKLAQEQKKAYMILQIHDELIFEVPDEELASVRELVRSTMEDVMQLKVPLLVDIHIGKNWKEC